MNIFKTGGSDSPVPYTLTPDGIQLNDGDTFPESGHVNIKFTSGDGPEEATGIHFDPNNGHTGGQWIGQSFIPWTAFEGLEPGDCVTWIQIHGYNEHYGEGGQEAYCLVGEEEPPVEEPEEPTPEEPEVPTVTKYGPLTEDTCDGTTWSHPAWGAYGGITHYEVSVNGGAREPYTPGDVLLVSEDGGAWSVSLFAYSDVFPMGHQLGQSKGIDEVCEVTPPVDPEEPEEPEEPETPDPEEPEEPEEPEQPEEPEEPEEPEDPEDPEEPEEPEDPEEPEVPEEPEDEDEDEPEENDPEVPEEEDDETDPDPEEGPEEDDEDDLPVLDDEDSDDSETVTSVGQPVSSDDQLAVTGSGLDITGILVSGALLAAGASLLLRKKIAR